MLVVSSNARLCSSNTLLLCLPSPLQDPYANAYYKQWRKPTDLHKTERIIGRGGWVGTHNYELDSGAYFISLVGGLAAFSSLCMTWKHVEAMCSIEQCNGKHPSPAARLHAVLMPAVELSY